MKIARNLASAFSAWLPESSVVRTRWIVLPLALLIFVATFRTGIQWGMDQMMSLDGYGRTVTGITSVLTAERFGERGYAVSNQIFSEFMTRGLIYDPVVVGKLGLKTPDNLYSGWFIDSVLDAVRHKLPELTYNPGDFRGFGADDIGIVDLTKFAFALFGYHIRALYYAFFLIYGASIALALLERRDDRIAMMVILATTVIMYAFYFYSPLFPESGMRAGTLTNPRVLSALAMVPTVHVFLMMAERAQLTFSRLIILVAQAAIIFFAIHMRVSAAWSPIGVSLAGIVSTAMIWRRLPAFGFNGRLADAAKAQWVAIVVIGVVLVGHGGVALSLNRAYKDGGWLQQHAFWHSVFYSLQFHPNWTERFGAMFDGKVGDEMPIAGIFRYLKKHPEKDTPQIYLAGKTIKYSQMEVLGRAAFFDFAFEYPRFVLETFLIYKPGWIANSISSVVVPEWRQTPPIVKAAFLLSLLMTGGLFGRSSAEFHRLRRFVLFFGIAAVASLSVPLVTVPGPTVMTEQITALQIALFGLLLVLIGAGTRATLRHRDVPESDILGQSHESPVK